MAPVVSRRLVGAAMIIGYVSTTHASPDATRVLRPVSFREAPYQEIDRKLPENVSAETPQTSEN